MSDTTARLALPYLHAAQAQKEVTHNEALQRLDICVQAVVEDVRAAPPAAPVEGACWLVDASPTGDWSGHAGQIAQWTQGGWRYVVPFDGFQLWQRAASITLRHNGGSWSADVTATGLRIGGQQVVGPRAAAISAPSGGAVIDTECRARLMEIIAALQGHGLISN
jgi:hypothetical protein